MATAKNNSNEPTVRRIKASDEKKVTKKPAQKAAAQPTKSDARRLRFGLFGKIIGYFKGAWFELRQVRWPSRRATWGMTGALLTFTAVFVLFILVIDVAFEYLFKAILK